MGCYLPNIWGLYDMHGNIEDWCLDFVAAAGLGFGSVVNPVGQLTQVNNYRSMRGDHWEGTYGNRSAWRNKRLNAGDSWAGHLGFRVVCLPAE